MRKLSLVQIWLVAWTVPSHYRSQWWNIVNWTIGNKLQWNRNRNLQISIQENAFECPVRKMAAILSRPQCVNALSLPCFMQNRIISNRVIMGIGRIKEDKIFRDLSVAIHRSPYITHMYMIPSGPIVVLCPANERRRYFVTTSLIGWALT